MAIFDFLGNYFANPVGLLAFLSLIPLIIIYLIRPKPKKQAFPSLAFLMSQKKDLATQSFLSQFFKDPLFLIQLLALIILSASVAYPYVMVNETEIAEDVVVILDASASMHASFGFGKTRWDEALDKAGESLSESNTIILAGNLPEVILEHGSKREAKRILGATVPKDTSTDLFSALILADDFLKKGGKAVVISDFLQTENDKDLGTAASVMESRNIKVQFVPIRNDLNNLGIVDLTVGEKTSEIRVRNFGVDPIKNAELKIKDKTISFSIGPKESKLFTFDTPLSRTEISLAPNDAFMVDNKAYVSAPEKSKIDVLYITNNKDQYLYTALQLIDFVELSVEEPPVVDVGNYDAYVFKNVDPTKLLPKTIREVSDKVSQNGAAVIIAVQEDIGKIDYSPILDIAIREKAKMTNSKVQKEESSLTKEIDFGTAKSYFQINGNLSQIAFIQLNESVPVIGTRKLGSGNVLFYGLSDPDSSFKVELMFPVFWKRILEKFTNRQSLDLLNYKTGQIIDLGSDQEVTDPENQNLKVRVLSLDQSGFYKLKDRTIAVNLANELESDISGTSGEFESSAEDIAEQEIERQAPKDLTPMLAIFGLAMVIFELLFIKWRGDI